jgi:uncharacterized protein (TIGR03435 family)
MTGKITMQVLAMNLAGIAGHPVSDQTGLTGLYDLDLKYSLDDTAQNPGAYPTIATALQEQLGLKLESRKAPLDFVVIDSAERKVIGN